MKIAIASGKGGTGKTTIATNLAVTLAGCGQSVTYVDCDVEAPNGHLFLHPSILSETDALRRVPQVNQDLCCHCGACSDFCNFNAIVCLPTCTMVYEELCHSCGGCSLVCSSRAITETTQSMGVIKVGNAGKVGFVSGILDVGVSVSTPVVIAAKNAAPIAEWTLLDAPAGTSCPMIETLKNCDYVLLVTEPTPFGLHDLKLAIEVVKSMNLNCGVVINRAQPGMDETKELCIRSSIPILAEIRDDIAIAQAYSRGRLAVEAVTGLRSLFDDLVLRLLEEFHSDDELIQQMRNARKTSGDTKNRSQETPLPDER